MDQVRAIMKVLWQQRFWVLSCLGILIAAICWKLSASKLDAEFRANRSTIDDKFRDMDTIYKKPYHGNDGVNEHDRQETIKIRDGVVIVWQTMYKLQRDKVLKWPSELGDVFLASVKNLKFRDPIESEMRKVYQEFAVDAFPALVEIVQAKSMTDGAAGGAFGGPGGFGGAGRGDGDGGPAAVPLDANGQPIEQEKYIVQWLDQGLLRQQLDFKTRPTATQIWVTQEDLWVYETLLHCIANANEKHDATRPDNAAIRMIYTLEVGQKAAFASRVRGLLLLPAGVGAGEAGGEGGAAVADPRGSSEGGAAAGLDADAGLLAFRYIGADGAPIPDATTDSGGECRRLPVRMVLYMQQTAIPTVLIECANAALPIEVKRIRINPEKSGVGFTADFGAVAGAGGGGGGTDGGPRGGGSRDDSGGGGYRGSSEGGASPVPQDGAALGLATVEIQGVVYIYNPPDPATMSVPGGDETVASTETSSVAL
jgi:hypothetical protein